MRRFTIHLCDECPWYDESPCPVCNHPDGKGVRPLAGKPPPKDCPVRKRPAEITVAWS